MIWLLRQTSQLMTKGRNGTQFKKRKIKHENRGALIGRSFFMPLFCSQSSNSAKSRGSFKGKVGEVLPKVGEVLQSRGNGEVKFRERSRGRGKQVYRGY